MNKWILLASVTVLTALVAVVWAIPPDGPNSLGPAGRGNCALMAGRMLDNPELVRKAGLTEEQVTQAREALYQAGKATIQLKADRETAELEVQHLLAQPAPDEAAIMKAVEEAGRLATELRKAAVHSQLSLQKIVGKDKLAEIRAGMAGNFQGPRQERFGQGGSGRGFGRGEGRAAFGRQGRPGQRPPWAENDEPPPPEDQPEPTE